jgi:hypothetical protein
MQSKPYIKNRKGINYYFWNNNSNKKEVRCLLTQISTISIDGI